MRMYAPLGLTGSQRQPLTIENRIWGMTWTVIGGWAMLSLLFAIYWSHRTGQQQWAGRELGRRLRALSGIAGASVALLWLVALMPGPELAPSNDFLNQYGGDLRVVLQQLIFAIWLGVPFGMWGWTTWQYRRGVTRWITTAGGVCGVLWTVWKVTGVAVRYSTSDRIGLQSPISVALGSATLLLLVCGLLAGAIPAAIRRAREQRDYRRARRIDDEQHYSSAEDPVA
ncbi:hypothetical protein [Nocardia sp. CC227C]|uniref:hypothetical protein n=1 Tax=Nocardia sp. CC227C TaxID=3044562 RepID=UPI00278C003B|nr:hypothetical protein [Nocardia sp. CC227C]